MLTQVTKVTQVTQVTTLTLLNPLSPLTNFLIFDNFLMRLLYKICASLKDSKRS
jgi:hypothetical protein